MPASKSSRNMVSAQAAGEKKPRVEAVKSEMAPARNNEIGVLNMNNNSTRSKVLLISQQQMLSSIITLPPTGTYETKLKCPNMFRRESFLGLKDTGAGASFLGAGAKWVDTGRAYRAFESSARNESRQVSAIKGTNQSGALIIGALRLAAS